MKSLVNFLIMIIFLTSVVACGAKKQKEEETAKQEEFDKETAALPTASIFENLPPASDIAATIKLSGAEYVGGLINDPANVEKYLELNAGIQAANLGVYFADMTYNRIYQKDELTLQQFDAAQTLAEHLGTARALDQLIEDRFKENINDNEEARKILDEAFENANQNLRTENRQVISMASTSGWFIESLYLLTNLVNGYPEDLPEETRNLVLTPLIRGILNQEQVLDQLISIVEDLNIETTRADYFIYDLKDLKASFEKVNIEETVLNSSPGTILSNNDLDEISEKVAVIRRRIVEGTM